MYDPFRSFYWRGQQKRTAASSPWRASEMESSSPATSPSSSSPAEAPPPAEFLCPISRSFMADPVVVAATGWTFERSCIQACFELAVAPPDLSLRLPSSSSSASPLVLIPNVVLKSAILNWCDRRGLPRPLPTPPDVARTLVCSFTPSDSPPSVALPPPPCGGADGKDEAPQAPAYSEDEVSRAEALSCVGDDEKYQVLRASASCSTSNDDEDDTLPPKSRELDGNSKEITSPGAHPIPLLAMEKESFNSSAPSTSSSSFHHTSPSSSAEIDAPELPKQETPEVATLPLLNISSLAASEIEEIDASEEEILTKSMDADAKEQELALISLRHSTRESRSCRIKICTPGLLVALRSMLLSRCAAVQVNAAAALVNISLEPENKVQIVRCGAVVPLVQLLKGETPEACEHGAAALYSLALEGENRVAIGSLDAIPPLLKLFAYPSAAGLRARRDAGKALYHLSLASPNRSKLARTAGAVRALLAVAAAVGEGEAVVALGLARLAMMVVNNLAACGEGRSALMDAEAVSAMTALMRGAAASAVEEHCVAALYGMSRERMRFPGLARASGAEQELMRVAEGDGGDIRRKMAKKALRAMRREKDGDAAQDTQPSPGFPAEDDSNAVSDGLMSFRRRGKVAGNGSDINSAPF